MHANDQLGTRQFPSYFAAEKHLQSAVVKDTLFAHLNWNSTCTGIRTQFNILYALNMNCIHCIIHNTVWFWNFTRIFNNMGSRFLSILFCRSK